MEFQFQHQPADRLELFKPFEPKQEDSFFKEE